MNKFSIWKKFWLVYYIILFIILVWNILIIFSKSLYVHIAKNEKKLENLETILNECDNGDLLFLCGNTYSEKAIRFYTDSIVTHVALIFKDWNKKQTKIIPYIWEADYGQYHREGPRVMKLKHKLKNYGIKDVTKRYGIWKRLLGERPSTSNILRIISKYINYTMDPNLFSWVLSKISITQPLIDICRPANSIFCSELLAQTFYELGLLKLDKIITAFTPQDFLSGNINMNNCCFGYSRYFKF